MKVRVAKFGIRGVEMIGFVLQEDIRIAMIPQQIRDKTIVDHNDIVSEQTGEEAAEPHPSLALVHEGKVYQWVRRMSGPPGHDPRFRLFESKGQSGNKVHNCIDEKGEDGDRNTGCD